MKRLFKLSWLLSLWVTFCVTTNLQAQDLIVASGDSIQCKIKKEDQQFIYFFYQNSDNLEYTIIDKATVSFYKKNFYKKEDHALLKFKEINYPTFSIGINVAFGYRPGKVLDSSAELEKYLRGLKSGLVIEVNPSFFFSQNNGLGLHYILFSTGNEASVSGYGKMSDKVRISFIGPSWESKSPTNNRQNILRGNLGMGYLHYHDNAYFNQSMKINGGSIGLLGYFGVDLYDKNMKTALTIGIRAILGSIGKVRVEEDYGKPYNIELDQPENLSHLDLVIGIRFSN